MIKWNDKKSMTFSFAVQPNEEVVAFFERERNELIEREEVFKKRIKQLFEEEIEVGGEMSNEAVYEQIFAVFAIGYQHGWNDLYSIHHEKGGKQ